MELSIKIKTPDELRLMQESGKLLASVFAMLDKHMRPGISTMDINNLVENYIVHELNARPASKGQYDFPYVLNTSVNEVVCHGVPSDKQILKQGDIINTDVTLEKNGFITDSSKMYFIGTVSQQARRIVNVTYEAMWKGIYEVKPGATLGDIGYAIQKHAENNGFSVVREYCGHGIGREMHEPPQVLHFGKRSSLATLKEGMTFTIEPMLNQGTNKVRTKKDGWTVITKDRKLSAQWEHTIAVTKDGFEVLTLRDEEII